MSKKLNRAVAATFVVATAMLLGMASCKGRTMENMEPTGDTVEVVIHPTDSVAADTVSVSENL